MDNLVIAVVLNEDHHNMKVNKNGIISFELIAKFIGLIIVITMIYDKANCFIILDVLYFTSCKTVLNCG